MKIKVVIVDLELSKIQKRVVSGIGATALFFGLATFASAAPPHTFVAGEVLKAADLNANFADLDQRVSAVEATSWTANGDDLYTLVNGNVGVGTDTPTAKLDVAGTLHVDEDLDLLPERACRAVLFDDPGLGDLGAQLDTALSKYKCINATLSANTSWTWNTPIFVHENQMLYLVGEGFGNGAANITVTINMTQNATFSNAGTDYRDPTRVTVADGGTFWFSGVHVIESSNDVRPLSPAACNGGALFTSAAAFSRIVLDQIRIDSSEDVVGIGMRGHSNIEYGWTFVNLSPGSPRNILLTKVYTGWCFAGGYAVAHTSYTTLGGGVTNQVTPKLVYSQ